MKTISCALTIITLLFSMSVFSQSHFVRTYDQLTDNTSIAHSIKTTSDGGFICIGSTNSEKNPDIFMVKTDANGSAEWAKQCFGEDQSIDVALDVIPTSDGGYLFCGNSEEQRVLWKVDETGNDVWKAPFGEKGLDAFSALTETLDGGFIAVGDGMVVTKTDAEGQELWTRNKPTKHVSGYRDIKELPNGDLLIAGFFTARDGGHAVTILVKTDANGKAYWAETYGAGILNAIDVDASGNIWVAGNASYAAPIVLKVGSNGKAIWEGTYDENGLGSAHSIEVMNDGAAQIFTSGGFFEVDEEGKMQLVQTTPHFGFNKALVAPNGDLVMAGFSDKSINGYEKFTFMRMDESGFPSPTASAQ